MNATSKTAYNEQQLAEVILAVQTRCETNQRRIDFESYTPYPDTHRLYFRAIQRNTPELNIRPGLRKNNRHLVVTVPLHFTPEQIGESVENMLIV